MNKILNTVLFCCGIGSISAQFMNTQQQRSQYLSPQNNYGDQANFAHAVKRISDRNHQQNLTVGYHYNERLRMYQMGSNKVEARVLIDNIQVQNVQYKGFDFSPLFMPKAVVVQGEIWRNGQRLRPYNSMQRGVIGRQAGEFVFSYQDTMMTTQYEFRLSRLSLETDVNVYELVKKRANAVDAYSMSNEQHQTWAKQLNSINCQNADVDSLETYEGRLNKVSKEFEDWQKAPFWNELELNYNRNDPLQIDGLKVRTEQRLKEKKEEFERLDIPYIYAQKANEWYGRKDYERAKNYAQKAIKKKTNYGLGTLILAKISWQGQEWEATADNYKKACASKQDFDNKPNWGSDLQNMGAELANYGQQKAQTALNEADWEAAAENGERWKSFCNENIGCVNCMQAELSTFFEQLATRWQSYYQQLAVQSNQSASAAVKDKKWEKCETQLGNSQQYQQAAAKIAERYQQKVSIAAEEQEMILIAYSLNYDWAMDLYQKQNYTAGLKRIKWARESCQQHGYLADKMQQALKLEYDIQKAIFAQQLQTSQKKAQASEYEIALEAAAAAKQLDDEYNFIGLVEKNQLFDKIQTLGYNYVQQQVDKNLNNSANSEKDWLKCWENLYQQKTKYKLNQPAIDTELERLRLAICQRVQSQRLDKNSERLQAAISEKNFITAKVFLDSIRTYSAAFGSVSCGFSQELYNTVAAEVEICERYQQAHQAAEQLEKQGFYESALPKYTEANELYKNALVQQNFINPQYDLPTYIINKNEKELIISGCRFYQNPPAQVENALRLLAAWLNQESRKTINKSQESQELIALQAAEKYYVKGKSWRQGLKELLQANSKDKRWKYFKKAFKRAWRAQR